MWTWSFSGRSSVRSGLVVRERERGLCLVRGRTAAAAAADWWCCCRREEAVASRVPVWWCEWSAWWWVLLRCWWSGLALVSRSSCPFSAASQPASRRPLLWARWRTSQFVRPARAQIPGNLPSADRISPRDSPLVSPLRARVTNMPIPWSSLMIARTTAPRPTADSDRGG